jgi:hypothetical protein
MNHAWTDGVRCAYGSCYGQSLKYLIYYIFTLYNIICHTYISDKSTVVWFIRNIWQCVYTIHYIYYIMLYCYICVVWIHHITICMRTFIRQPVLTRWICILAHDKHIFNCKKIGQTCIFYYWPRTYCDCIFAAISPPSQLSAYILYSRYKIGTHDYNL